MELPSTPSRPVSSCGSSFADYLALWLLDAAAEYGVIIAD
jgi:hypothetical protein